MSYEPALEAVDFRQWLVRGGDTDSDGYVGKTRPALDGIIFGGESGPHARVCEVAWARQTLAQCKAAGVQCFVKQLGANPVDGPMRLWLRDSHGGDMNEWPADLRVREFPDKGDDHDAT